MADNRHSLIEDLCAFLVGTLIISIGLVILRNGGVMTGGTAGLALFIHYAFHLPIAKTFFVINLPFYLLAVRKMGIPFTVKSFCAVTMVSFMVDFHAYFLHLPALNGVYAAAVGNVLLGLGLLILLRHNMSIGGVNILAIYIAQRRGMKVGHVQLIIDALILSMSLSVMPLLLIMISLAGAAILNSVLAMNHRSDRYAVTR